MKRLNQELYNTVYEKNTKLLGREYKKWNILK